MSQKSEMYLSVIKSGDIDDIGLGTGPEEDTSEGVKGKVEGIYLVLVTVDKDACQGAVVVGAANVGATAIYPIHQLLDRIIVQGTHMAQVGQRQDQGWAFLSLITNHQAANFCLLAVQQK